MFVFLEYLERTGTTESKDDNTFKTFFFPFIFICWRLITLQYCSGL